jgi:hypothetical protein
MNDIQLGDIVEILEDDIGPHPTEDRLLKKGEHVVVSNIGYGCVFYRKQNSNYNGWVPLASVRKKVIPNQVEVKFR